MGSEAKAVRRGAEYGWRVGLGAAALALAAGCSSAGSGGSGGYEGSSSGVYGGSSSGPSGSSSGPSGSSSGAPSCDVSGTWDVTFQWSGRTPGALQDVISDGTIDQLSAPGVGAASGSVTVTGDTVVWTLSDGSTWTGTVDASCASIPSGTMASSTGTPGAFVATRETGGGSSSGSSGGSSSGGSTEACGVDFKSAGCASCVESSCCSTTEACTNDPTCESLLQCLSGCGSDTTCGSACFDAATSAATQELENATSCWSNSCPGSC